ncbi:MAG: hypothetical protein LLG20_21325 [Acidobacteriales bacterium]|nr:hypothetical protein [Terriglobales bacterium]
MRLTLALAFLASAVAFPQNPSSIMPRASGTDPAEVRRLVEAGVLPRAKLDDLERAAKDREDQATLDRLLYGSVTVEELTIDQAQEMVAAAERLVARRKTELDRTRALVDAGAVARTELTAYLLDYDQCRRTLDLATSRARLLHELAEMARVELSIEAIPEAPQQEWKPMERFDGDGIFTQRSFNQIELAFEREFGKPLPVSARGETAVHRMLGYDHRGRVDVALNPDQPEGVWLREHLEQLRIPYYAFRAAIPGKSTAPHIHMGPPSTRLRAAD